MADIGPLAFTGADTDPLPSTFTTAIGTFVINTNAVVSSVGNSVAWYNDDTFENDQYAWATDIDGVTYLGPGVRLSGTAGTAQGYLWYPTIGFYKITAGTPNNVDSTTTTISAGAKYKMSVTGNTLEAFKDTGGGFVSIGTYTDNTSPITSGSPGFHLSASNNAHLDDWVGGPLVGGAGGPTLTALIGEPTIGSSLF